MRDVSNGGTEPLEILHEFLRVRPGEDITTRYDAKQAQAALGKVEESLLRLIRWHDEQCDCGAWWEH